MKSKAKRRAAEEPTVYVVDVAGRGDHGDVIIERMALHPLPAAPRTTYLGSQIYPFRVAYSVRGKAGDWADQSWFISCRGMDYDGNRTAFIGFDDADAILWLLEGEAL